jgi:stress-induced morphogen
LLLINSGDGSFFNILIESPDFIGLNTLKQHQLIYKILADEVKLIHGIQIQSKACEE